MNTRWIIALLILPVAVNGAIELQPPVPVAPTCVREGKRIQRRPAVAFGKSVYLVAWSDGSRQPDRPTADIYCSRIDAQSGRTLDPNGIRVCAARDLQEYPAVAFDGANFLVVWQDLRGGQDYDIYGVRVSEEGMVLDGDGFAICKRGGNQARPAVSFAGGNFVVVWMDAREYPVYGLYGARVSLDGKVLDGDGRTIDAESAERIAKIRPTTQSWLGGEHYWWQSLQSRFAPRICSDGKTCMVTYLRDVHANQTVGYAVAVNPADLSPIAPPVKLSGEPKTIVACCDIAGGWLIAFDQWISGWSPTPRLAAARLSPDATARDIVPVRLDSKPDVPTSPLMLDLQKLLAGSGSDYQQGKGHFAFWHTSVCRFGADALVVTDYAWRARNKPADISWIIAAARFDYRRGQFVDEPPTTVAVASGAGNLSVRHPAVCTGPDGQALIVYEMDDGIDRLGIEARVAKPAQ